MLRKAQQPCGSRIIHSRIANAHIHAFRIANSEEQASRMIRSRIANAHIQAFRIAISEEQVCKSIKQLGLAASGLAEPYKGFPP